MKVEDYPMVKIVWVDAESYDDWEDVAEKRECKEITTMGFLLSDDDKGLSVAMQLDPTNEKVSMTMIIPNHWIVSIVELR